MVEPIASGFLNAVLPRHVAFMQSSTLKRAVAGSPRRPSLAANFFIPTPRSDKGKAKELRAHPIDELLTCQSWATPPSNAEVWNQGSFPLILLD